MQTDGKKTLNYGKVAVQAVLLGCATLGGTAHAQITRGFIGPHEYSLPDPSGMKPWNVFVEYSTLQSTKKAWNSNGDKVSTGDVETLVSISKYVHFWSVTPSVGIGWEVIAPKVHVHDKTTDTSTSGFADPLTGPAFWIRPNETWTLGTDMFFVQVPIGEDKLRTTRWNVVASLFWDGQFGKFNYTGNIGTTIKGPADKASIVRPGNDWYFNNRFGYRVTSLIEPYVGLDYAWTESRNNSPKSHELVGAVGLMFHMLPHSHIAVHYQRGFDGENTALSNNLNLRFAYVF